MNRDNKYWAMIHYQRGMYKRLGYKKTRVRQIIKAREKTKSKTNFSIKP